MALLAVMMMTMTLPALAYDPPAINEPGSRPCSLIITWPSFCLRVYEVWEAEKVGVVRVN